jgi:hypothetical protein
MIILGVNEVHMWVMIGLKMPGGTWQAVMTQSIPNTLADTPASYQFELPDEHILFAHPLPGAQP